MTDTNELTWWQRPLVWLSTTIAQLAKVTPIMPGMPNDGMIAASTAGSSFDKNWADLRSEFEDSLTAWQKNPMARRLIGLITAYVVGPGITVTSENEDLQAFIEEFWSHPMNNMDLRVPNMCDELSRSGELFPVLFTNPADGMSYIRTVPAALIEEVDFADGDYERELRYKEQTDPASEPKWWYSLNHEKAHERNEDGRLKPWMLHYAVNRPIGFVRGEGDLVPILPWLRRYEGWLGDRVGINAAMRAFYWIVYASRHVRRDLENKYRRPPAPGSIIFAEEGAERWEAVTPDLKARDAKEDGRAIRWMIAAGGPGIGLADLGEGEESGLTKGKDSDEQRRRFLLRRQRYFVQMLSELVVLAYNRRSEVTGRGQTAKVSDIITKAPDISSEDNERLAVAAKDLVTSLTELRGFVGDTETLRKMGLRLYVKFVGEALGEKEFESIMEGDPIDDMKKQAEAMPQPANSANGGQKPAQRGTQSGGSSKK